MTAVSGKSRPADANVLLRRYATDRRTADLDQLVERFLPLAYKLARRYSGVLEPMDDLQQVAALGLIKALNRYDPDRGYAFSSFAVPTILGELRRHFRDHAWAAHVPRAVQERVALVRQAIAELSADGSGNPTVRRIAAHLELSEEQVVDAMHAWATTDRLSFETTGTAGDEDTLTLAERLGHNDPGYEQTDDHVTLESLLPLLTERERRMIELRFLCDMTQTEIAEHTGVSQMQVSRVLRAALLRLSIVAEHQVRLVERQST